MLFILDFQLSPGLSQTGLVVVPYLHQVTVLHLPLELLQLPQTGILLAVFNFTQQFSSIQLQHSSKSLQSAAPSVIEGISKGDSSTTAMSEIHCEALAHEVIEDEVAGYYAEKF